MHTTLRRALVVSAAALTLATPAFAADPGACYATQTSRVDALMNPVTGGDEKFFSATGSPTTVMFLVGTYQSMQQYITALPNQATGCSNATMQTAFNAFYNQSDATKDGHVPVDADPAFLSGAQFFDPARFYHSERTKLRSSSFPASGAWNGINSWGTANTACAALGLSGTALTTCESCMGSHGWYRSSDTAYVVKGGVLNQNPPKFVTTRAVVKEVAGSLSNVRIGFSAFNVGTGDYYDTPRVPVRASPACNALSPIDSSAVLASVKTGINTLAFTGTERQIGEALFGIGAYFSRKSDWKTWFDNIPTVSGFPGASGWNNGGQMWTEGGTMPIIWDQGEATCSECQSTMVIVLTDGTPDQDNSVPVTKFSAMLVDAGVKLPDGTNFTFNPTGNGVCPNNSSAHGGVNFCDRFGATKCDCDYTSGPVGPRVTNRNFMDDVAFFLANWDLRPDLDGMQTVRTYTIGLGDPNAPMLQSIAYAGNGLYYTANNASQLKSSVIAAIQDVQSKTTGFSGAAVAGIQTGSGSEAVLPRMLPRADKPWLGSLWRFEMYNEFVEGVSITDGGLNNIVMIDDAGVPVVEDLLTGQFNKAGTATTAHEFWEAGEILRGADNSPNGHRNRKLWTVRDGTGVAANGSGADGRFTSADTVIEFTVGNRAALKQYLGVASTPFCPRLAGPRGTFLDKVGRTVDEFRDDVNAAHGSTVFTAGFLFDSQAKLDDLCVGGLILYVRGADLADEDGDGNRSETRRSVLADIFHSTPVTIVPPVDKFLCELGIVNQCARTLFAQQLGTTPTPLESYTGDDCQTTPVTVKRDAYEEWMFQGRKRQKPVLVGSNDGVLHAFDNGTVINEDCTGGVSTVTYNQGTGREIWGFIPPDLLSRLQDSLSGHMYGVDGDIMVRDVWADRPTTGTQNNKEVEEFHTVAIVGEGRGGTHYFAVEVEWTDNAGVRTTVTDRPKFLWMYPQPGTPEAALFGKTMASITPKPPPIGPVLLEKAGAPLRYGVNAEERWVVALSGGWSPGREKGRGVYIVDAYNGFVDGRTDNLLAKFEFRHDASGDNETLRSMGQSVIAPVALVDYGSNVEPRQDGFFDTAVWGDMGSQVWTARLFQPGQIDTSTDLVTNWRVARAFEMDRDALPEDPADGDPEPDDPGKKNNANRQPFYFLPAVVIEPGTNLMRTFIGSGERYSMLDAPTPICRFDNPLACSQSRCNDVKTRYRLDSPAVDITRLETNFKKRQFAKGRQQYAPQSDPACGVTHAWFEENKVNKCQMTTGPDEEPGRVNDADVVCGLDVLADSYSCNYSVSPTIKTNDLLPEGTTSSGGLGINRYFGFVTYGGSRTFLEGNDSNKLFDDNRLTDRGGTLVDVTTTTCTGPNTCTGPTASADGWFIQYDAQATKTATGSALLASCVLWNTVTPAAGGPAAANVCSAGAGAPEARLAQANYLTGAPDCAAGFSPSDGGVSARYLSRTVVAPPPEPVTAIQVSKTGQVRTSALLVEPGQSTSVNVTNGQDILQMVYELPITRALHNCRHNDGGCVTSP